MPEMGKGHAVPLSGTPGCSMQMEAQVFPSLHQSGTCLPVSTHGLLTFSPRAAKRPQHSSLRQKGAAAGQRSSWRGACTRPEVGAW